MEESGEGGLRSLVVPELSGMLEAFRKPLLAFSAGVDSTALFHLLLESGRSFSVALVNYHLRPEADAEESYAAELSAEHGLKFHSADAPLWKSDFEAKARRFRYGFFEDLVDEFAYDAVLTAHQLNDRLEWMMMRLVRGAGACAMSGMDPSEKRLTRKGSPYTLLRPLLDCGRSEIEEYLRENAIKHFIDSSNASADHERNRFRMGFCNDLVKEHADGIRRSFRYLRADCAALKRSFETVVSEKKLRIIRVENGSILHMAADRTLKEMGYCLGSSERGSIEPGCSIVAGRRWAVESRERYLFIAPYLKEIRMEKEFRELCRKKKIPPKIRAYCYSESIDVEALSERLGILYPTLPASV